MGLSRRLTAAMATATPVPATRIGQGATVALSRIAALIVFRAWISERMRTRI